MRTCPYCDHSYRRQSNTCPQCGRLNMEAVRSIRNSPSPDSHRRNNVAPRTPNNSFEKGTRTDERGLAYLDGNGHPLKMKEPFDKRKYGHESIQVSTGGNS